MPSRNCGRWPGGGNLLLCGYVLGFGTWSVFAPIESAAIASGVVENETSRKTLQHLEGGIVKDILVAEGDKVEVGQTLVRLDPTKARAESRGLTSQILEARAREARLLTERSEAEDL